SNAANATGESNRSNVGSKGRGNPYNMAEKRAYDRAVFRLLGITGLLSEEELQDDEEQENKMEGFEGTPDEFKKIAPIVNQLILAKTKDDLAVFNKDMKDKSKDLSEEQLKWLRKRYKRAFDDFTKVKTDF
ncbi:MAG TPA: hypothetical protein VIJ14_10825, partial [Rhabdochlamydiaceae bacterium]